jgi:ppGpp synthetase/RelA/SpoT-type nucleotidyltranferase
VGSALDLADHGRRAAADYRKVYPEYLACASTIEDLLTAWLDAESINYLATSARAKSIDSFRGKASRGAKEDETKPRYREPLREITDLVGARVITYLPEAVDRASDIIRRELLVIEDEDKGARARQQGVFGYASRHFLVKLDPARAAKLEYKVLAGKTFEIQVRTVAQHAWAEFEHDVRYKVLIPPDRKPEFDRRFLLAAALMELADSEFTEIDRLYRELAKESVEEARGFRSARESQAPIPGRTSSRPEGATSSWDPSNLTNWLAERYGDAPKSKREHYAWMFDLLARS